MTAFRIDRTSPFRITLLATTMLALSGSLATARVGVTSATDGDPLGKPPTEAERVLRIGIDVQANELVTTRANDRAHLVFLDGTSLTVGPNAQLTIDRFVYDPNTKTGELAVSASKGVLRLVGGKISKNQPITITTPASTIGIRGGITILTIEPNRTTSTFVFGKGMSVSAAGLTQMVTRQGTQVTTTAGAPPGQPTIVPAGGYTQQLSQLEGGGGSSSSGTGQPSSAGPAPGGATSNAGPASGADQKAQASGFSKQNSSQAPAAVQPPTVNITAGSPAQNVANANIVSNALTNAAVDQQQQQAVQQQTSATVVPSPSASPNPTPTPAPNPGPNPNPTPTPQTQVIITSGGFAMQPTYTNFNPSTLTVTPVPGNNLPLQPTGTLTDGVATITLSDGRSFDVPWLPGQGFYALSIDHPTLGPLTGRGQVGANGEYFTFAFLDSSNKALGFAGGTPTTMAQFPTSGVATHAVNNLTAPGGIAFAPPAVNSNQALAAAASQSPMYSVYSTNAAPTVGQPTNAAVSASALQATVSISGQGSSQKSYMGVYIAEYFKDFNNNTIFNSGTVNGTYRLDASQATGRVLSSASTFDTGAGNSVFGPNADAMVFTPSTVSTQLTNSGGVVTAGTTSRTSAASLDQTPANINQDYATNTLAVRTTNPAGLGQNRTTQTMNGYVGGLVENYDPSSNTVTNRAFGVTNAAPSDVVLKTDATANRVEASFTVRNWRTSSDTATFKIGGINAGRIGASSFVDDRIYAARESGSAAGTTVTSGSVTSGPTSGVTSRTTIVSAATVPQAAFFASQGVTPCTCDFMTWGWWSGQTNYGNNSVFGPNTRDRQHLATYVAGNITPTLQMPTTGVATFSGHAIGNVQNGAASYVAAGSFTKVWNFAAGSGTVTIGNFDGSTYGGTANQLTGTTASQYSGTISNGAGRSGNITGSFFDSSTVRAKGTGGSFNVNGPGYQAGGTFAGQR